MYDQDATKLIIEGIDDVLHDMGYFFEDEGKHKGKWVHEKTGKALSDRHAQEIAAERHARKSKTKKETTAAGLNPTDKDARKQGEESTRSEEVEYYGNELEENNGRFTPSSPLRNKKTSRTSLVRGHSARGLPSDGLPGRDTSPYGRARMRGRDVEEKGKIITAQRRASDTMFKREFGEELFHKDADRLLREHIREQYESLGIYPTSREVQQTFNEVMNLLEKVSSEEKARRQSLIHGDETEQEKRMRRRGVIGGDRAPHVRRRGERKISPSSPARQRSFVEMGTRMALAQGVSPEELIKTMNHLRRTNR